MKFRTTKEIKENYEHIISIGYHEGTTLLKNHEPIGYVQDFSSWYDLYVVNGVAICTGYRGMPGKVTTKVRKYEELARKHLANFDPEDVFAEENINRVIENLLESFIHSMISK